MKKNTILIVDDLPDVRETLQTAFQNHPLYTVVGEAMDGLDAIDQVETHKPDVVILDNWMPKLHGIDAISSIKQASPPTKIIMHTNSNDRETLNRALEKGALGYILKAESIEAMYQAIQLVLENKLAISRYATYPNTDAQFLIDGVLRDNAMPAITGLETLPKIK